MTRRPTTRLAYCTGMRRCPPSTKTMNATTAIISAISSTSARGVKGPQACVRAFSYKSTTARGSPTTIPTKMISDIPLPMPRSLICSPSHMMNAEPVVSVRMVISVNPQRPVDGLPSRMGIYADDHPDADHWFGVHDVAWRANQRTRHRQRGGADLVGRYRRGAAARGGGFVRKGPDAGLGAVYAACAGAADCADDRGRRVHRLCGRRAAPDPGAVCQARCGAPRDGRAIVLPAAAREFRRS